jgi:hypothetical protein
LKNQIIDFGDDGNFKAYGFTICRTAPRVTYDMEQMRKDGIDVDKYKKQPSALGAYRITCPRNKR